jgi:hypothetical protein
VTGRPAFSIKPPASISRRVRSYLALGILELGFLLCKPGFLLFMRAQALSKRTGHAVVPQSESYGLSWRTGFQSPALFPVRSYSTIFSNA